MTNKTITVALIFIALLAVTSIIWYVQAIGIKKTGEATGITQVSISQTIGVNFVTGRSTVSFSSLAVGASDDTTDNSPLPFLVRNDGSVKADVTISATSIWSSSNRVPIDYRYSTACSETSCFNTFGSTTSANPLTTSASNLINDLDFVDAQDEAEIDIYLHVPPDEPAGAKSSTVTVTGSDSTAIICCGDPGYSPDCAPYETNPTACDGIGSNFGCIWLC